MESYFFFFLLFFLIFIPSLALSPGRVQSLEEPTSFRITLFFLLSFSPLFLSYSNFFHLRSFPFLSPILFPFLFFILLFLPLFVFPFFLSFFLPLSAAFLFSLSSIFILLVASSFSPPHVYVCFFLILQSFFPFPIYFTSLPRGLL